MATILSAGSEPKLRFRASDVRAMVEAGVLDPIGRYEVLEGEIVPMQAHNPPHMRVKRWLLDRLYRQLDETFWIDSEPSFYLEPDGDFTVTDIIVYPRAVEAHLLRGPDALLVVEVTDRSLVRDTERKGRVYARHGVREYWVVEARMRRTHVFTGPSEGGFGAVRLVEPTDALAPGLLPGMTLRLDDVE